MNITNIQVKEIIEKYKRYGLTTELKNIVGEWVFKGKFNLWLKLPKELIDDILCDFDVYVLSNMVCLTKNPNYIYLFAKVVDEAPIDVMVRNMIKYGNYDDIVKIAQLQKVINNKFCRKMIQNFQNGLNNEKENMA